MRVERFFNHRCTLIIPGQVIGQDPYGRDQYGEKKIKNVPCRVDQIRKRTAADEYGTDYVTQNMLFVGKNQPIKNDVRFTDFVDSLGHPIIQGEYRVSQISPVYKRKFISHYEVTLTEGS